MTETTISGMKFKSVEDEKWRKYIYPGGEYVLIENPVLLNVNTDSGGHRVLDSDGYSHYVKAGWLEIIWKVVDGAEPFAF